MHQTSFCGVGKCFGWDASQQNMLELWVKSDNHHEYYVSGLINMILKSYFLSQVPDILFVPVSVNYDRLLEENLFSFELLGIPKPRETTSVCLN